MLINLWKARAARRLKAEALYRAIMRQTRRPEFYDRGGVADSFEGRFDLLVLHVALVILRLRAEGEEGKALAQSLFDVFFTDMDAALRELGVADTGVGKRIRHMSEAFYGRLDAYGRGLADDDGEALRQALARNLYGSPGLAGPHVAAMAGYVRDCARQLAQIPPHALETGPLFTPPPEFGDAGARPPEDVT